MTETAPSRGFFERPLWLLTLSSFKEFYREPIALFWVYGFPLVLCLILGYAIRNKPVGKIPVIVVENSATTPLVDTLKRDARLEVTTATEEEARSKLRTAKAELAVLPSENAPGYLFLFDETRPESVLAKSAVEMTLLRRENSAAVKVSEVTTKEPGSRYIDFFLPGMLGANIMGGGLWGVGYGLVDMRVKKLLKRLVATPMRKSDFLGSMVLSRLIYTVLQLIAFLVFAFFVFGITVRGNWLAFFIVVILGTACFAGFGLLVAARTSKLESAQGLMNLVMLPSYIFSGVFFSSANFPDWSQPLISILPLTALNDSLRAVMNEGAGLNAILLPSAVMIAWTAVCYAVAAKTFKWV